MKHPLFNKTVLIFTAAIAFLFSSCNLLTLNTSEKTITVSGKINSDFDFNSGSTQNRSSMPELSIDSKIFKIKAVSGKKIVTAETDSAGNFFLQLTAGSWNISASYYESEKLVLSGETDVTVNEGQEQNSVSITVGPVQTATGSGTVNLLVAVFDTYTSLSEYSLKIKATWKIKETSQTQTLSLFDPEKYTVEGYSGIQANFFDYFTFTPDGFSDPQSIQSGSYEVTFTFGYYDDTDNLKSLCYQCTETINVYDNLRIEEWKDDTGAAPYFANVDGRLALCLTDDCVQNFAMYNYFVDGNNGSASGSGSYNAPFNTIQTAVDKIIANNDETNDYTIYLLSDLTVENVSNTLFNSTPDTFVLIETEKKLNLKITSLGDEARTVDINSKGYGFVISGVTVDPEKIISVTFENIKVQNGNANNIYMKRNYSELNIENGTVISGANGSGIYSEVDNVTLNIKGGEITANNASVGGGININSGENVILNITGGKIFENTVTSTFSEGFGEGEGIYYKRSKDTYFYISGKVDISDNICLIPDSDDSNKINIAGDIQLEHNNPIHIAILPSDIENEMQVLTASSSDLVLDNYTNFVLDNPGYEIASDGKIYPVTALYVDTEGKNAEITGSETKPYKTISDAVAQLNYVFSASNSLGIIYFKGSEEIKNTIEIKKYSIKLQGWKDSETDTAILKTSASASAFDVKDNAIFNIKDIDVEVSSGTFLTVTEGQAILSGSTSIKPSDTTETKTYNSNVINISTSSGLLITNNAEISNYRTTTSVITNSGTLVINGKAKIYSNSSAKDSGNTPANYMIDNAGKLTVTGSAKIYGNFSKSTINNGDYAQQGEVTISGNAELSENTATNGGAIMNYSGTVTVQGKAKIFSNKANNGGAIYNGGKTVATFVESLGTVTIQEDAEIYSNEATSGSGGAIYNYNNYAVIIKGNAQIYSNEALTGNGGAIYSVSDNASVTISENAKISKNKARSGGGIYHSIGEMIIKDQTEIYSNEALTGDGYGGAIYIGPKGIVTIEGEAKFYENKAQYGGAIYNTGVKNSFKGTITIQGNTQFYSNTASSQGGSIYNNLGEVTISGSTVISDNEATSSSGGAIYNDGVSSILTIKENTQIKLNKATTYGGAIYNKEGAVTIGSETDDENKVIISENTATATGGAIYNTSGTVTVQGKTQISSNKAKNGGAIYSSAGSSAGTFTVKGNTQIKLNEATSDGGAVYCGGKSSQVIIGIENDGENKVIISENTAGTNGGVIFNGDSGKVTIQGNTQIKSNKANNGSGGVIYNNKGEVEISGNVEIQDNEAVNWGGVIFNTSSGNVTIHGNVKIELNKVTNTDPYYGKGGAIFNASGKITIGTENDGENKVIISGNTASNSGGGIHNDRFESYLIIQGNTQINTNTASWGGGICNSAGDVTIGSTNDDDEKHVTISGNISDYRGGAIYNDDNYGNVKIQGKTNISSNTSYEGGAISSYSGTVTIKGNTQIISNTATTTGGAIYNNSGQVTIQENVIIKENKAISTSTYSGKGGAIFTSSSKPVTIGTENDDESQVTISNNEASYSGGAIFISSGAVTIKNTTFSNNKPVNNQIEGTYTDEGNVIIE